MAKVLVAEDDADVRGLIEMRIRRMGHLVIGVGSGEEVLAVVAEKGPPELVVLDVRMPGMSGFDCLAALRQDPACATLPAIFLSGRVEEADIEAGRALGATYLTKPLILTALASAVDKALVPAVSETW